MSLSKFKTFGVFLNNVRRNLTVRKQLTFFIEFCGKMPRRKINRVIIQRGE